MSWVVTPPVGRIQDRGTFRDLRRPARRAALGPVSVSYVPARPGGPPFPRVGYAVSRRCGNAVARNRLRRRLRAAMWATAPELAPGAYLVRPDPAAAALDAADLAATVRRAVARIHSAGAAAGRPGPAVGS